MEATCMPMFNAKAVSLRRKLGELTCPIKCCGRQFLNEGSGCSSWSYSTPHLWLTPQVLLSTFRNLLPMLNILKSELWLAGGSINRWNFQPIASYLNLAWLQWSELVWGDHCSTEGKSLTRSWCAANHSSGLLPFPVNCQSGPQTGEYASSLNFKNAPHKDLWFWVSTFSKLWQALLSPFWLAMSILLSGIPDSSNDSFKFRPDYAKRRSWTQTSHHTPPQKSQVWCCRIIDCWQARRKPWNV